MKGLRFAAKDIFDIAGHVTGCGNPDWLRTHAAATATAPAVARLLEAGSELTGKTITDELAYSLNGQNFHYGTPVNVNAPAGFPAAHPAVRPPPWRAGWWTSPLVPIPAGR